ncbi:SMAD/FHA domain-containing protein [Leucosporidium creatinivorum]|uniref:SMAD/FHA domain-containing protein n=1 Tax=Leucosporidium creatinivorum TaxID=106004 RepID=A0A1Y2EXC6_9BASI|nr:SMAD/FHA domain-containing protein [Leucosporidium creatinivorum]
MAPPNSTSYRSDRPRSRSRSPPPRRPQHGADDRRSSSYRDSRADRERDYDDRDRDRDRRGGSSRRDRDDYDDRRDSRRRSKSRSRSRSRSRSPKRRVASPGRPSLQLDKRNREREQRGPLPSQQELVSGAGAGPLARGGGEGAEGAKEPVKPIEPNFAPSGALAAETKYHPPRRSTQIQRTPEARKPVKQWRMYVFKGKEQVDLIHVHRQSAYLLGRDRIVVDIPIDHPSTSKQHAVLQFRQVVERNEFGDTKSVTKPYIIDLDSANGTMVNDASVPPSRYYEVKSGDVLKFAFSTREYVLLAE